MDGQDELDLERAGAPAGVSDGDPGAPADRRARARARAAAEGADATEIRLASPRRRARQAKRPLDVTPIYHLGSQLIARATGVPQLALADEESQALSAATVQVLTEYDVVPPAVGGRVGALIALISTALVIAVPRVIVYLQVREQRAAARRQEDQRVRERTTTDDGLAPYADAGLAIGRG